MKTKEKINAWIFSDAKAVPKERPSEPNIEIVLSDNFQSQYHNVSNTGIYRTHGWAFDYRPILKKYIVKSDYYLIKIYSLNKTLLRKSLKGFGRIHYITEAPTK